MKHRRDRKTSVEVGRQADRFQLSPAYTPADSVAGSSVMRLVLLALLVVAAAGLRPKRTLGIIFRGLVDAQMKQAQPKKESAKVEKLKSPPPPAKIYLIPVPERDKKSQVQLFNTHAGYIYKNTTRPLPPFTENFVTPPPAVAPEMNKTTQEPKQFLIRILNEEGKSFMLKITGDDVQVKKKGNGYMIGVSHNQAKANINIELPDKSTASKNELTQSTTNLVDKAPPPLFTGYPPIPEKYQLLEKGPTAPDKLSLSPSPIPPFPAFPLPIFLAPQFFQPQALPYENSFHDQKVTQYPTTIEKSQDPPKQIFTPTKQPEVEDNKMNTTKEVTKPTRFQVTVRLKGDPVMKKTVAEMRTTTEMPTTQGTGYHYPAVDPRYQYPPLEPRYQYQQPYPEANPPRYQQPYPDPQPPRYQWYLQPPAPPHHDGGQQADQHRDYQHNNWNFAHFTPYPSYLQDTLSPPYLPTGYGRSGHAK